MQSSDVIIRLRFILLKVLMIYGMYIVLIGINGRRIDEVNIILWPIWLVEICLFNSVDNRTTS